MTRHPAKFTDSILEAAAGLLGEKTSLYGTGWALDPFAGTGKGVEFLDAFGFNAIGVELEPEWAHQGRNVVVGDALELWFHDNAFDLIFTSPCYGNRMADHHEAKDDSRRNTYRHALGRPLTEGSAAGMQWGPDYREFHRKAWREALRVLRPGGSFLLNVKNHIRNGTEIDVVKWHRECLRTDLQSPIDELFTPTSGNRQGQNGDVRVEGEWLLLFQKGK